MSMEQMSRIRAESEDVKKAQASDGEGGAPARRILEQSEETLPFPSARDEERAGRLTPEETARLRFSPDPEREINPLADAVLIRGRLEQAARLIEQEEQFLATARAERVKWTETEKKETGEEIKRGEDAKAVSPERLKLLREAQKELKKQHEQVGIAEEWQEALDTLHTLQPDELSSVQKTGLLPDRKRLRARRRELDPRELQSLARLAGRGVTRLTWGKFSELFADLMEVMDVLLKDALAPLKQILG